MNLTKDEWSRHAEIAAAHKFGEDHAGWYTFKRYGAAPVGIAALAGLVGWGVYWLWHHIGIPGGTQGGLPIAFWIALTLLLIGSAYALRRPTVRPAAMLVRAVVLSLLWLGFVVYGLTVIL